MPAPHDPYADEARERWGETDAYRESGRRVAGYSGADWERIHAEAESIEAGFADALGSGLPADGPEGMALARRHRAHIDRWYYPCSLAMHAMLAQMYVADPRFTSHYDDRVPGLAQYVHDAIAAAASGGSHP